jgi:hypothetical protein
MKETRKRIWIHSFQTRLLIRITAYLLVYLFASWAFFALCERISAGFAAEGESSLLGNPLVRGALAAVILVPPLAFDAMRFAHRLVGPLYRIHKTVQAVAAGEPVPLIQLREGDFLVDLKDDVNEMLTQLEKKGLVIITADQPRANTEQSEITGAAVPTLLPDHQ